MGNVNRLIIIISLSYSIVGYFLAILLVSVMGGSEEILVQGAVYFRGTLIGSISWIECFTYTKFDANFGIRL